MDVPDTSADMCPGIYVSKKMQDWKLLFVVIYTFIQRP